MTIQLAHTKNLYDIDGCWFMDKGSGTNIKDYGLGDNDGTASNCTWASGYFGYGLEFNGSTSYVSIGNPTELQFGTGSFSISFYFKRPTTPALSSNETLVHSRGNLTTTGKDHIRVIMYYHGGANDGKILFSVRVDGGTGNQQILSDSALNDGDWHNVICQRLSNGDMEMYVDGTKQADTGNNTGDVDEVDNNWYFGAQTFWGEYLDGFLDEVIIRETPLSQSDVDYYNLDLSENIDGLEHVDSITEYVKTLRFTFVDSEQTIREQWDFLDDVRFFINGIRRFRGRVVNLQRPRFEVKVYCHDYTTKLLDVNVNRSYTNREISTLFTNTTDSLIHGTGSGTEGYLPGVTTNNVQTTSQPNMDYKWVQRRLFFTTEDLAKISPDYDFYIDEDWDLHFEERHVIDSGYTLENQIIDYNFPKIGADVYTEVMVFYMDGGTTRKGCYVQDSTAMLRWGTYDRPFVKVADPIVDWNIEDETMAVKLGLAHLRRLSNPVVSGKLSIFIEGYEDLRAGEIVRITIPELSIDKQFVVLESRFKIPDYRLFLDVFEYREGQPGFLKNLTKKVLNVNVTDVALDTPYTHYQHPTPETVSIKYDWVCKKITSTGQGFELGSYTYGELGDDILGATGISEQIMESGTGVL